MNLLKQPTVITRRAAGDADAYGNTPIEDTGATVTTLGYAWQTTESDQRLDQNQAASSWFVALDPSVTVGRHDRIYVGGLTFEVVGRPRRVVRAITGQVHHIEVQARLVEG